MTRGWSGGQFSMLRVALAALAAIHAAFMLRPVALAVSAAIVAIGLALGVLARTAALGLAVLTLAVDPLAPAGWPLAATLVTIAAAPPAPFGSVPARGRVDPGGGWRMPGAVPLAGTALLALALLAIAAGAWRGGRPALALSAALAAAGLASARARPAAWSVAGLVLLVHGPAPGVLAPWLLAFEPRWLPPRPTPGPALLFYDGTCGMCHGSVRLMLAEEPPTDAAPLRFGPLGGERFERVVPEAVRSGLPDSVVLVDGDGTVLTRARATVGLGRRLGGLWRAAAELIDRLPGRATDALYDLIARHRRSVFSAPDAACPLLPPALRTRFER